MQFEGDAGLGLRLRVSVVAMNGLVSALSNCTLLSGS